MSTTYRFLPWVRQGLAAGYKQPDPLTPALAGNTHLPAALTVNGRPNAAAVDLQLYGPADVAGIDPRAIIRVEPAARTVGYEPNYLPFVEFDDPDFPWLFTPAAADGQGRLRPWLCLVVVEQQEGVTLLTPGDGKLPILSLRAPAQPGNELPDLAEAWAWAHAQVFGDANMDVGQVLGNQPAQNLSRLLCPRRLAPNGRYLACLVPAFEAGRLAGLGQTVPPAELTTLHPAWASGPAAPQALDLPVYYSWEFSTGAGGDFEELARQLTPQPLAAGVGVRPLLIGAQGFGLPDGGVVNFEGALRPPCPRQPEPAAAVAFGAALRPLLNLAGDPEGRDTAGEAPLVGPPIYGSRQAAQPVLPEPGAPPVWLDDLNLNPALRAAAGLGSLLVQDQQEKLMAAAWDQLGEAQRAASLLRRLPFNQLVLGAMFQKRVAPLSAVQLLQFAGPAQSRVRMGQTTLLAAVRATDLPEPFTATAFRRVLRPGGPIMRRLGAQVIAAPPALPISGGDKTGGGTDKLDVGPGGVTPPHGQGGTGGHGGGTTGPLPPIGGLSLPRSWPDAQNVATALVSNVLEPVTQVIAGPITPEITGGRIKQVGDTGVLAPPEPGKDQKAIAQRFMAAAGKLQAYYLSLAGTPPPLPRPPFLDAIQRTALVTALDPLPVARARILTRLPPLPVTPDDPTPEDLFDQLPSFPQPMSSALSALSQDFLLPGAGDVTPESVSLLETNPLFVEAFMVGLNHEMGRELLWREFPSDQRPTFFRVFWDTRGAVQKLDQLPPIHTWQPDAGLGAHLPGAFGKDVLVLLIRGQLLLRYPTAIIYAVKAASPTALGTDQKQPLFRGRLDPDMTFLGFDLTLDAAKGGNGDPGWFFVIQEQPTAPRFGMDELLPAEVNQPRPATLDTWDDLTWADVKLGPGGHISLAQSAPKVSQNPQGWQWNFNAAHMAAILRQRPSRVAMPAALMLPDKDGC